MTTGTEGPDNLANDQNVQDETVDALGGDDIITVRRPNSTGGSWNVHVNGGSGFDTIIVDSGSAYVAMNSAQFVGSDLLINWRTGLGTSWNLYFNTVERFEARIGLLSTITLGDEIDILQVGGTLLKGRLNTAGGNDEVRVVGEFIEPVTFDGGAGNDIIDLSQAVLTLHGSTVYGGDGDDVLTGLRRSDLLDGGAGDDILIGNSTPADHVLPINDQFVGGAGNDTIIGGVTLPTDRLRYDLETGTGGALVNLSGSAALVGGVTLASGEARDTFGDTDTLTGIDHVVGNSGNDHFLGHSGANEFTGGAGDDNLSGLGGNDLIDGGAGNDTLDGGDGVDTVTYASSTGPVTISLAVLGPQPNVGSGTDTLANFENLTGSSFGDTLTGDGGANLISGGGGSDTLIAGGGTDSLLGGADNDALYFGAGYTGADLSDGGADVDVLILQGNYSITLGAAALTGLEALSLQSGSVAFWGDTADNRYDYNITTVNSNVLAGTQMTVNGQSLLVGEDLTFDGSAETDGSFIVYAGHGVDTLKGGANGDVFYFEGDRWGASDSVDGGGGTDVLVISAGTGLHQYNFLDTSFVNVEAISVSNRFTSDPSQKPSYELVLANGNVGAGQSLIVNGSSLDSTQTLGVDGSAVQAGLLTLFGGAGNDALTGGGAADLLFGGDGRDDLTGGGGADVFRYDSTSDSELGDADELFDFLPGVDKFDLSRIDADTTTAGDQAFTWIGSSPFTGVAGQLRAFQVGAEWIVQGDTNGDTLADLFISVTTQAGAPPTQGDFLP